MDRRSCSFTHNDIRLGPTASKQTPDVDRRHCTAGRYARRSKEDRLEWGAFTQAYFLERPMLAAVLLLVDASVPPQQSDLACVDWLADAEARPSLVNPALYMSHHAGPCSAGQPEHASERSMPLSSP